VIANEGRSGLLLMGYQQTIDIMVDSPSLLQPISVYSKSIFYKHK